MPFVEEGTSPLTTLHIRDTETLPSHTTPLSDTSESVEIGETDDLHQPQGVQQPISDIAGLIEQTHASTLARLDAIERMQATLISHFEGLAATYASLDCKLGDATLSSQT